MLAPFTEKTIRAAADKFPTPFHLYDEAGLREACYQMSAGFNWCPGYKNYYAVKANPNPAILRILREEGMGADCSSIAELELADMTGFKGEDIIFTSNNTPLYEFERAMDLGAIVNLDDISHLPFINDQLGRLPEFLAFRYNPGPSRTNGNAIIGNPSEAKFGMSRDQILHAYKVASKLNATKGDIKKWGLHCMMVSNCQNAEEVEQTAQQIFGLALEIYETSGVAVELINLGGGFGINYVRNAPPKFDVTRAALLVQSTFASMLSHSDLRQKLVAKGKDIRVVTECGRFVAGPNGCLVSRVIHQKNTYKHYVGVDACMSNLMRPGMYGSHHHIEVFSVTDKELQEKGYSKYLPLRAKDLFSKGNYHPPTDAAPRVHPWSEGAVYDVVGSLCENNDKFAIDRELISSPAKTHPKVGDVLTIFDSGAHGHSMGFTYNGKVRSAEVLVTKEGELKLIRRAETLQDYLATVVGLDGLGLDEYSVSKLNHDDRRHKISNEEEAKVEEKKSFKACC